MVKEQVIVTGGAGFIGSNLCKALVKDYDVYVIDYMTTGSIDNKVEGVNYTRAEAKNIFMLYDLNPKYVFHLGEYSRVEQSFDDIRLVFDMNQQMITVLEFCREKKAKLIYSASSSNYSGANLSPYTWTKSQNVSLIKNYHEWFNIDFAICYFYNVYGPNEIKSGKYATVIAKFLEMKRLNKTLTVVSPGTQERNFTHVDDIVDGILRIAQNGSGDGYGIGCDKAYSILEVASMISDNIEMIDSRAGNRMSSVLNVEKTRMLGWCPKNNLKDYIESQL